MDSSEPSQIEKTINMTIGDKVEFISIPQEGKNIGLTGY